MVKQRMLPDDVIDEILERLPVKKLSQCSRLKNPIFIKNHSLRRKHVDQGSLLYWNVKSRTLTFHDIECIDLDENYEVHPKISAKFLKSYTYQRSLTFSSYHGIQSNLNHMLLGPCEGVVCIVFEEHLVLCNPSLREFKELPICVSSYPDEWAVARGFGNTCTNDFKVFVIISVASNDKKFKEVRLYTLSTNSWRTIDSNFEGEIYVNYPCDQIFFNGSCHWHGELSDHRGVVSFNLSTEVFKQLEYPDSLSNIHPNKHRLVVVDDCLAMLRLRSRRKYSPYVEIWVMKEYGVKESWTRQLVMTSFPAIYPLMGNFFSDDWKIEDAIDDSLLIPYKENLTRLS